MQAGGNGASCVDARRSHTARMRRAALLILAAAALLTGCENLVALCNAKGAGTPEECEARWGG